MTISSGTRLGRYEVRSKIGEGGMGEVYLARDTELDRSVALKILPAEVASNQERLRRFSQEAKAAAALNHQNIAHVYEIGESGSSPTVREGVHFIAMEFVDGETLRERLRQSGMKLSEVLEVATQVASALAATHAAGIVHRDIKPENIMVRRDGFVKVLDFGLAKLTAVDSANVDTEAPTRFKTDPGTAVGTAIYMSPEQARGLNVDARTDMFSLGIVLYEMVAGRLPFDGTTSSEVLASILSEKEPQPLARYSREAPAELERIVSKALRKNRDQRYQTIQDLLLDLKSLKQELDFERKLERSLPPKKFGVPPSGGEPFASVNHPPEGGTPNARPTVGERGLTSAIKLNQRSVVIAVAALLIIAAGVGSYFYFMRARSGAINSIAVLPFINASGNSELEYLSDGLTESLITSLSQLPKLSVKARSSVFRYKGKDAPPQQAGKELNVQAILNGRVVQRGNDLTLHIELVDVDTETALWSGDYNRSMTNLVSLPSEIARDVSSKLRLTLSGADEQKLAKNYTANAEAYQLYLKGRYHYFKSTQPEIRKGIAFYQQAIDADPTYALAYAGMADAYRTLPFAGYAPSKEAFPQAKAAAMLALEIDYNLAEAHIVLGWVGFCFDWDWIVGESELKKAIEISPNNSDAHRAYAHFLSSLGRHDEAIAEAKRARELDPLTLITNALEGQFLFYAGRDNEAISRLKKTLEIDPNYWIAHNVLGRVYTRQGRYDEAIAELNKAKELSGGSTEPVTQLAYVLAKSGKREQAKATLEELKSFAAENYVPAYSFAMIYNGLGEKDEALKHLEKSFQEREVQITFIKIDTRWDELRGEPRFQDLLRRVGFPQ